MNQYLSNSEYRRLKSNLTRAINSGDPLKVIATCRDAFDVFERFVAPDDWHRWQRAHDDAVYQQQRKENT